VLFRSVYIKSRDGERELPLTKESSGETGIAIKYYHFHNAAGECAPAVYLVADDSLESEELSCHEVTGLGNGSELGSKGWLCFCKTRQANLTFYRWFAKTIVEPFVTKSRDVNNNKNLDGSPMRAFVTCDGEEAQIRVFQEAEMLILFLAALIDFGKTPASCSAICQSSDVSDFFKALKTLLANMHGQNWKKQSLCANLKIILRARAGISVANQDKIVDGLQKLVFGMQKVLNPDIIIKGYQRTGQDAPIGFDANGVPTMAKFEAQMRLCTSAITLEQMQNMKLQFPGMVDIMRRNGTITEAEMDAVNIPSFNFADSDKKPKDQRALHKQRAVVMNMDDCISKYKDYHLIRAEQAVARVLAEETRKAVAAARKADAEAKRAVKTAEKRRRDSLTPEERKEEATAKRKATALAKRVANVIPSPMIVPINQQDFFLSDNDSLFDSENDDEVGI